jgi:hypothetical protein
MAIYPEPGTGPYIRRHTGIVGLLVAGSRPEPKSGQAVLDAARRTDFFEPGRLVIETREGGSIECVPHSFEPNGFLKALTEGMLLYRFTITGTPPARLRPLEPGTYYTFMDFLEGPDAQEGRWIVRIVNTSGQVECVVPGVEVKQLLEFHVEHKEEHSRPRIETHGIGTFGERLEDSGEPDEGGLAAATPGWVERTLTWQDFGAGCLSTVVCVPER